MGERIMSTETRCVVTLQKGIDISRFLEEMTTTYGDETIPPRKVDIYNEKPDSLRNFDFMLTHEEAETLRNDPRVIDVRIGSKAENGIFPVRSVLESNRIYSKTGTLASTHYNWAFASCTATNDPFSSTTDTIGYQFPYTLAGEGVDIVIQDSGIDPNHPEWLSRDGQTNRLQQIDWPTEAGLGGVYTQAANHYTDPDGHGTHVAGTAAGRLYGWAKDANIYAITIIDNSASFGISASFNLIRNWHLEKGNDRPTVVNMSWGYFGTYENINSGNYRGNPWTGTTMNASYGMIQGQTDGAGNWTHPVRVASVDADIQDCLDAGIILVAAAGNDSHKADIIGGDDYDNYFTNNFGNRYYHRGSTPMALPGVISVGNISNVYVNNQEPVFNSSTKGPRVDINAPGGFIMSAIPDGSTIEINTGSVNYPFDANYKATKISGTSMASPQVAGIAACLLGSRKRYTSQDVLSWLIQNCDNNRIYDSTTGTPSTDYQDFRALQGAPNRYLKTPFVRVNPFIITS
jgi:subtilisin family serine protease